MEIDAQTVIGKLTKNFASQSAASLRDNAILESQVEALQSRVSALESENANLSHEVARLQTTERIVEAEGDVIVS